MFPYKLVAGGVGALALVGGFYYQSLQIHHFHALYDRSVVAIALKDQQIRDMTTAQNNQLSKTEGNVIKVVTPNPKIINEIKTTPGKGCDLPKYSDEVNNAF